MQTAVFFVLLFTAIQSIVIKQYHYIPSAKAWQDARLYCKEKYTELAIIDSQTDQEDLLGAAAGEDFFLAWIGMHRDTDNITGWKWSGRPGEVTFTNWDSGEPNNHLNRETKTAVKKGLTWVDANGSDSFPFFCVRFHVVQETKKSWEKALQHCREAGSDLLSLRSEQTPHPTAQSVWVGLRFLAGRWLWVDGEPLWHQAWPTAAAQGSQDHQCPLTTRCGALSPEGVLEARDCQESLGFICKNPLW